MPANGARRPKGKERAPTIFFGRRCACPPILAVLALDVQRIGQSTVAVGLCGHYVVRPLAITPRFFKPPKAPELRSLVWPEGLQNSSWARVTLLAPVLHPLLYKLRPNPLAQLLNMRIKEVLRIARRVQALSLETANQLRSPDVFSRGDRVFAVGPEAIAKALAALDRPEEGLILRFVLVQRSELDSRRPLLKALLLANNMLECSDQRPHREALEMAVAALYQARTKTAAKLLRKVGRPSVVAKRAVVVPDPEFATCAPRGVVALHPAEVVRRSADLTPRPAPILGARFRGAGWGPLAPGW